MTSSQPQNGKPVKAWHDLAWSTAMMFVFVGLLTLTMFLMSQPFSTSEKAISALITVMMAPLFALASMKSFLDYEKNKG